jgi:hypothetical protein
MYGHHVLGLGQLDDGVQIQIGPGIGPKKQQFVGSGHGRRSQIHVGDGQYRYGPQPLPDGAQDPASGNAAIGDQNFLVLDLGKNSSNVLIAMPLLTRFQARAAPS